VAMEPPHPHAWRVADRWLSTGEKRAIVEAYTQIHARGVLHRDVALRHMLVGTLLSRYKHHFPLNGVQAVTGRLQSSILDMHLVFHQL
jgi:hypothetical protein